ncbi:putative membrane protein [Helicobacter pylori SouthAfrica20]|uniref:Putative membrane protein n=1 Tax=Helicobacter pylori SouthAfrica20 TaxID=1352356 RepID=T1UC49_HELPX|nr:putative membrane protein [Helicobacter pylori SouthAfrica20]
MLVVSVALISLVLAIFLTTFVVLIFSITFLIVVLIAATVTHCVSLKLK